MNRWQQLVQHAHEQTDHAARGMEQLRQQIAAVDAKREQMEGYRQEYAQRAAQAGTVTTVRQINTLRNFSNSVGQTVAELEAQLSALRERYEHARGAWQARYNREQALISLQRMEAQKQQQEKERLRRREEDDFALLAKRRRDAG